MKKYDFAVVIGRFQPFHIGHMCLVNHAFKIANHVIIVIGSHNAPISMRNPWTTSQREECIRAAISESCFNQLTLIPLHDSAYNFTDWIMRVQQKITAVSGDGTVAIVGHYKDDTSYYLNYFPQWTLDKLPTQADGISATDIRNAIFEDRFGDIEHYLPDNVMTIIKNWTKSDLFEKLQDEYRFIQNYRKKWESAPYPPIFVTADSVVIALGHVLLVKRKVNPGKGCYALPGGFVNHNESIQKACLRELKEETGLDVGSKELNGSLKLTHVFDHPLRDPRGRVITHAFMFELNVKTLPHIEAGDDAQDVQWFPLYKIEQNESSFFNDHAQIIKYFVNHTV